LKDCKFCLNAVLVLQNGNADDEDDEDEDMDERGPEPFPSPPLPTSQADFTDQWVSQAAKATESGELPVHSYLPVLILLRVVGSRWEI
jgi:hypothetical protein